MKTPRGDHTHCGSYLYEIPKHRKTTRWLEIHQRGRHIQKGSKHLPVNYRPVSLTCICSKVMEHIVVSQIGKHLDRHHFLDPNQLRNPTHPAQELHSNTARGKQVDDVVMNFSKALDNVAHNRLFYKLGKYDIESKTKNWIKNFLANCSQQVVLDGMSPKNVPAIYGVPTGVCPPAPSCFLSSSMTCQTE